MSRELAETIAYAITAYKKSIPAENIFTVTPTDANGYLAAFIARAIEIHCQPALTAVGAPPKRSKAMKMEFDTWYELLRDLAASYGESANDESAWREDYEDGKSPEDSFYNEYPEHRE